MGVAGFNLRFKTQTEACYSRRRLKSATPGRAEYF